MCRIGIGVLSQSLSPLALFVPSPLPSVTCWPGSEHAPLAAGWALAALGRRCRGGHLVLISDPSVAAWAECLVTVMAVDDAEPGGTRLLDRILRDPRQAAELVAAVHL